MTLDEHLADTSGTTEVAVDLEGRMGIKEVGISTTMSTPLYRVGNHGEHVANDAEGMVAIEHTRPEIDFPAQAPSRGHVATLLQRVSSSSKEVGMSVG